MSEPHESLNIEVKDNVAQVTLLGPGKGNAMGPAFWEEMPVVFADLDADPEVRAIVLTGSGRNFSYGLDLMAMGDTLSSTMGGGTSARPRADFHKKLKRMQQSITAVADCRTPTIASVHGWCIGGGVDLISAVDIRYASADAKFSVREVKLSIVADVGSLARLPGTLYSFVQWRRLARYERQVVREATHTIAVSDADAETFRRLAPGCPVSVVPNGIDVAGYAVADTSLDLGPAPLVFTGSMGYRPNVDAALWFANHVLDRVRAHVPEARFFIVGSRPHRRLNSLRDRDGVQITGWVPDIIPFLSAAAVYVVPLRMGSGTRLKLLQAMAARRAVVSTRVGAQGLDVQDGVQLRLADTEEGFARAVIELLRDPAERAALGERAAQYVARNYDWPVIAPRLLAVYDQVRGSAFAAERSSTR